jgi:hypothetical protein
MSYAKNYATYSVRELLSWARPHLSRTEKKWIRKYLGPLNPRNMTGAYVVEVPGPSTTLFSCHTDTVHWKGGGRQVVELDTSTNTLYKLDGMPLGADDGSGCWLMMEMIDAGIPGTYFFHRGEERGGIGSTYMAKNHAEMLKKFSRAIAFDRKRTYSVITSQGGRDCCSKAFGKALSEMLNLSKCGLDYRPDPTGVFTDTANYTGLIAECTNLSVGYENEHTGKETQDLDHLYRLRDACLSIAWEDLPTERVPGSTKGRYQYREEWEEERKTRAATYATGYASGGYGYGRYANGIYWTYFEAGGLRFRLHDGKVDFWVDGGFVNNKWEHGDWFAWNPAPGEEVVFPTHIQKQIENSKRVIPATASPSVQPANRPKVKDTPPTGKKPKKSALDAFDELSEEKLDELIEDNDMDTLWSLMGGRTVVEELHRCAFCNIYVPESQLEQCDRCQGYQCVNCALIDSNGTCC